MILEAIRVTVLAIRQGKDGGWILGAGIMVIFLAAIYMRAKYPPQDCLLDVAGEFALANRFTS